MLHAAKISLTKMRNSIINFSLTLCILYIGFLLLMKLFGLMHVTELRMFNYVILCLVCIYQIKRWVHKTGAFVPFLQVFFTTLFTGVCSFLLFSAFLFVYTRFDVELNELFVQNTPVTFRLLPTAIILFEGSAASIIVALINLQYFRRYEEGEVSPKEGKSIPSRKSVPDKI
jgi:hypothetical protein